MVRAIVDQPSISRRLLFVVTIAGTSSDAPIAELAITPRLKISCRRGNLCGEQMRFVVMAMIASMMFVPVGAQASPPARTAAANASNATRNDEDVPTLGATLSTSEKQGYGCLVAGGAALALTAVTGTTEVVALFTGATTLAPAGVLGTGLAVAGTVVASTCAVGALVAPTAIRLWRYYHDGAQIVASPP